MRILTPIEPFKYNFSCNNLDSDKAREEVVQNEAISICSSFRCARFLFSFVLDLFLQDQLNVITKVLVDY